MKNNIDHWQIQEAKAKFSELIKTSCSKGPQFITHRGNDVAVIISIDEYLELSKPKINLYDFIQQSPLRDSNLNTTRDKSPPRDINL